MARSTIKMWGPHLKSADTRRKLQKYDQLRNDPRLSSKIHDRTITFGPPPSMSTPFIVPNKRSSNDRRLVKSDRTWSQQRKVNHYREIFGNELKNKYDYIPYVDILTLPTKDRPHTFAQCIDFFYPMSGVTSHISTTYPFTTTFPQAYEYGHESAGGDYKHYRGANVSTNKMPVDLGEITMMYIWYTMYKILLVKETDTLLPEPEHFLTQSDDKYYENVNLLSEAAQRQIRENVQNLKNQIGVASATIDMAGDLAQSFANGDFDNANTFEEQVQVFGNLVEGKKYTEVVSSFIKGQVSDLVESMGLSSSLAKPIAGFIVGSAMNPKVYNALSEEDKFNLEVIAGDRLKAEFAEYADLLRSVPSDAEKIIKSYITKDYTQTIVSSPQAKNLLNKLKSSADRHLGELYTKTMKQLKARNNGVRENGILATIGISLATKAVTAQINSMAERAEKRATGYNNWFRTNKFVVNPEFTEEGFELAFDDFTTDGRMASGEHWYATSKMYCSPRNGMQEAEFAKALYTIFRPIAARLRRNSSLSVKQLLGDRTELARLLHGANIGYSKATGKINPIQFQKWFTSYNSCQTYKIFLENAILSTQIVFQDIESFSPFTQAYGLEPLFLEGNASNKFARNAQLAIIGDPKAAGKEYTSPASPSGAFIVPGQSTYGAVSRNAGIFRGRKTDVHKRSELNKGDDRQSCNPGSYYLPFHGGSCNHFRTTGSNEQGWTTPEVEKYYADLHARKNRGVVLVGAARDRNSQRRLSDEVPFGHYGSTSLGFDVAYGIPIFNAQWPALVSVLSVYPKAVSKMKSSGYQWASKIITEEEFRTTSALRQLSPVFTAARASRFIVPSWQSRLSRMVMQNKESSQVTSGESQTTSGDEESMTSLYVALGLGITAIAGASYYVIQKKKGKF